MSIVTESALADLAPISSSAAIMDQCLALVGDDLELAERELDRLLQSEIAVIPAIGSHLAMAGGKRFRPLLALLAATAAECTSPHRITVAAVSELLHTATLLHDDVVDQGEFRRGRPTARMAYGNGLTVLTGDYYLAQSLSAVAELNHSPAVRSMARTVTLMAEGEVAQLYGAGDASLNRSRYMAVIERKTATLIAWASSVGEIVDPALIPALHRYGMELGYAFQIADDVLDYAEDASTTGKNPAQDLREGKMTLPLILACEHDETLHQQVCATLEAGPPMDDERIADIMAGVQRAEGADRALEMARAHCRSAVAALSTLPETPAKAALIAIAEYTTRRRQ